MHNNNAVKNLDVLTIMDMLEKEMVPAGYKDDFEFFLVNHVLLDSISRLAKQDAPDRKEVIGKLRRYVQAKIPKLSECSSYQKECRNRRTIMWMNYHGFEDAGQFVLKVNKTLHGK